MNRLFAHRGMSSLAPENTLSSFSLCKPNGISWIECDVDMLSDGTIILSHDDTLDRCTNKSGSIYDLKYSDLENIDAGSWFSDAYIGERIPTLRELIKLLNKDKLNINIEIKSCSCGWEHTLRLIQNCVNELSALSPKSELMVSSFNHLALAEFKHQRPTTNVACLFTKENLWGDWKSILQACKASAINIEDNQVNRNAIHEFKQAGYEVNVYTVNDLSRANELFNWGVDGIFTDIAQDFPAKYKIRN